jgi:hypothetical protein
LISCHSHGQFPLPGGFAHGSFQASACPSQSFPELRTLEFHWKGERGLSPISLTREVYLRNATNTRSRQSETSKRSHFLRPLKLLYLQEVELANVVMDASQVASFLLDHRKSLRELNFQIIILRTGTWDEALASLTRMNDSVSCKQYRRDERSAHVPIMLKPMTTQNSMRREHHPVQR